MTFLEGLNVKIVGPNFVTVGVPSSIECVADCSACTYSMSLDGHSAQGQGNVLDFTLSSWVEALTVTCTVTDEEEDEDPEQTSTVTKQLQVLGM